MDSYQKYAADVFKYYSTEIIFKYVKDFDLDEVAVSFALVISELEYADNFRIFPLSMEKEFYAIKSRGCCGSFNSQIKCLSGNIYWIGCNYGH